MIPANGAAHDLEARDVHRSLPFAQRRVRDNSKQIGASPNLPTVDYVHPLHLNECGIGECWRVGCFESEEGVVVTTDRSLLLLASSFAQLIRIS
jgi:hypothetical protein